MSQQNDIRVPSSIINDQFSLNTPSQSEVCSEVPVPKYVQNDETSIEPPIYGNHITITVQPHNQISLNKSVRRPIPVNTTDWVSTPRLQLNALSGIDFLVGIEQLEIQRIVELSTLLGEFKPGNQYRVKVPRAETIFLATEVYANQRDILGFSRGFTLNLVDPTGELAFTFRKEVSLGCLPGLLHKMTVECVDTIGSIEQNFTIVSVSFTVYNASREPLCNIYGPNICRCCMYKEAQFQIVSMDGTHQIATLMHQWDRLLVDYSLILTVPLDTDVRLKGLLLGATFLMEYLYFERLKKTSSR